jgi:hypothetical protein
MTNGMLTKTQPVPSHLPPSKELQAIVWSAHLVSVRCEAPEGNSRLAFGVKFVWHQGICSLRIGGQHVPAAGIHEVCEREERDTSRSAIQQALYSQIQFSDGLWMLSITR